MELASEGSQACSSPRFPYAPRRRVYDALNVLLALGVIARDKKARVGWFAALGLGEAEETQTLDVLASLCRLLGASITIKNLPPPTLTAEHHVEGLCGGDGGARRRRRRTQRLRRPGGRRGARGA